MARLSYIAAVCLIALLSTQPQPTLGRPWWVGGFVQDVSKHVSQGLNDIGQGVNDVANGAGQLANHAAQGFGQAANDVAQGAGHLLVGTANGIAEVEKGIHAGAEGFAHAVINPDQTLNAIGNGIGVAVNGAAVGAEVLGNGIHEGLKGVGHVVNHVANEAGQVLNHATHEAGHFANDVAQGTGLLINHAAHGLNEVEKGINAGAEHTLNAIGNGIGVAVNGAVLGAEVLGKGIHEGLKGFGHAVNDVGKGLGEFIAQFGVDVAAGIEGVSAGIGLVTGTLAKGIEIAASNLFHDIGFVFGHLSVDLGKILVDLVNGIGKGITEVSFGIGSALIDIGLDVGNLLAHIKWNNFGTNTGTIHFGTPSEDSPVTFDLSGESSPFLWRSYIDRRTKKPLLMFMFTGTKDNPGVRRAAYYYPRSIVLLQKSLSHFQKLCKYNPATTKINQQGRVGPILYRTAWRGNTGVIQLLYRVVRNGKQVIAKQAVYRLKYGTPSEIFSLVATFNSAVHGLTGPRITYDSSFANGEGRIKMIYTDFLNGKVIKTFSKIYKLKEAGHAAIQKIIGHFQVYCKERHNAHVKDEPSVRGKIAWRTYIKHDRPFMHISYTETKGHKTVRWAHKTYALDDGSNKSVQIAIASFKRDLVSGKL